MLMCKLQILLHKGKVHLIIINGTNFGFKIFMTDVTALPLLLES